MQEQKGEEWIVAKSKIYSVEPVFTYSGKFLIRENSDCIPKPGDAHSYRETWKQDEKKFEIRRSVEFSSKAARCIPWRVDGQSNGENLSQQKRNQEMWIFPNLKPGVFKKRQWRRDPLLIKKLRGNPMHPVNQTTREAQKLKENNGHAIYTCLQPQFTIRKQSSRSSGRSTDENMTTIWMIRTWLWPFGHVSGWHSSSNSSSWTRLWGEFTIREESSLEQCGTVIPWNWKTDQWSKWNHWKKDCWFPRCHVDVDKLIVRKCLSAHQRQKPTFSPTQCFVWWKWEMIQLQLGRTKLNGIRRTITSKNWIASRACRRDSSGKYSQESQRWASSRRFNIWWETYTVNLSTSTTGSSSCQCTTTLFGEKKETQKGVNTI